jgi:hypothetical protein
MSVGVMEDYKLSDFLGQEKRKIELFPLSLLWIDKARAKDKRYKEVSVWWKTTN